MSMTQEFKTFAMRGNVVDMAVGIVIGAAFGKIVSSLVGDVIMPPLGMLLSQVDFSQLAITLRAASDSAAAVELRYGVLLENAPNGRLRSRLPNSRRPDGRAPDDVRFRD